MLCVVVPPIRRSVVLVSVRVLVCLLRERSALESGEGIIVYIRRPKIALTKLIVGIRIKPYLCACLPLILDEAKESLIAELKSRGNNAFKNKRLMEADILYSKVGCG